MKFVTPKMDAKTYGEVGFCIYCGSKRYASDSNRQLATEHIIPFGLNGDLVLPRSSCRRCERITGRDESILLKGALLGCRSLLGLRTRNPKDRPKVLPLFDATTTPNRKVMVNIEHYPINLLLLRLGPPPIVSGQPENQIGAWSCFFSNPVSALLWHYGLTQYATSSLDAWTLNRVLAKIGHCFAVAELGTEGFIPFLPEKICNPTSYLLEYVGGLPSLEKPSRCLHEIDFEPPSSEHDFLVVRVHLLAFLNTPIYQVVVGLRKFSAV